MEVSALPALRPLLSSRGEAPSAPPAGLLQDQEVARANLAARREPPRTTQGLPVPPAAPGPSPEEGRRWGERGARRSGGGRGPGARREGGRDGEELGLHSRGWGRWVEGGLGNRGARGRKGHPGGAPRRLRPEERGRETTLTPHSRRPNSPRFPKPHSGAPYPTPAAGSRQSSARCGSKPRPQASGRSPGVPAALADPGSLDAG